MAHAEGTAGVCSGFRSLDGFHVVSQENPNLPMSTRPLAYPKEYNQA